MRILNLDTLGLHELEEVKSIITVLISKIKNSFEELPRIYVGKDYYGKNNVYVGVGYNKKLNKVNVVYQLENGQSRNERGGSIYCKYKPRLKHLHDDDCEIYANKCHDFLKKVFSNEI